MKDNYLIDQVDSITKRRILDFYIHDHPGVTGRVVNEDTEKFIKKIEFTTVDSLLSLIKIREDTTVQSVLSALGVDSLYLVKNAERLIDKNRVNFDQTEKEYYLKQIKNYEKILWAAYQLPVNHSDEEPISFINVQFFAQNDDVLQIFSKGRDAYLLPWNINRVYLSYNPNISILLGKIFPESKSLNKEILEGGKDGMMFIDSLASIISSYFHPN